MNFIFFYPDELRAESVGCYGHPLVQTPNFDRLAAEGTRFDQCHVQHTVCTPSRCSLMTGWYPHVTGHRTLWHMLRPHEPSLFHYMHDAGYQVRWYGKNDLYAQESFPLAVDYRAARKGEPFAHNPYSLDDPRYYTFLFAPSADNVDGMMDTQWVCEGIDFLRSYRQGDKPFVLYFPLGMPHPPYGIPEYIDKYNPAEMPPMRPADLPNKPDFHALIRQYRRLDQLPDGTLEKIQAAYLGQCSYSDWLLGLVLTALDETGLASDTAVIATSDHGDWAGDFGLVEKWPNALDDTLTRVPLLVRMPGGSAGHVVDEPIEAFDIMATMLELAGIEAQHTHFARSLVPQLHGAPGDASRAVFAEGGYDRHEPHCLDGHGSPSDIKLDPVGIYYPKALQQQEHPESVCRATMLRTMEYKLMYRPNGVSELYDLRNDPQECTNLYDAPAYAGIRKDLEGRLLAWMHETADVTPWDEDPRGK